jgi:arylsulfatase A-like enzyme
MVDLPVPAMDGVSLVDVMRGTRRVDLEVVAESMYPLRFGWSPLRSLRGGRYKLVDAPRPELYDLERDPFETRNLFDERRNLADAMRRRLDAITWNRHVPREADGGIVPPRLRDDLAALGYVTASPIPISANQNTLPDPKDRIGGLPHH